MKLRSVLLLVLLTPILFGCGDEPVSTSQTGILNGTVVDFASGLPLANTFVSTIPTTTTTQTDADGNFSFGEMQAGTYKIIAEKDGYETYYCSVIVKADKNSDAIVPLKKGELKNSIIYGVVKNKANNKAITDVKIDILPKPAYKEDIKVDANGAFIFKISEGNYSFIFSKEGFTNQVITINAKANEKYAFEVIMQEKDTNNLYPVYYYSFDGTVENNLIYDDSQKIRNATVVNKCEIVPGYLGNCLKTYEGGGNNGGWLKLDYQIVFNEFTISFWVKEISQINNFGQAYFQYGNNINGVCLMGRCGRWSVMPPLGDDVNYLFAVGAFSNSSDTKFHPLAIEDSKYSPKEWNMLSMTFSSGLLKAYINGTLVGSKEQKFAISQTELLGIGSQWWSSEQSTRFTALYDEFMIFDYALTDQAIMKLYNKKIIN